MKTMTKTFSIPLTELRELNFPMDHLVKKEIRPWIDSLRDRYRFPNGDFVVTNLTRLPNSPQEFLVSIFVEPLPGICLNCGQPIMIAIFRNGEWCSDDCRKALVDG